MGIQNKGLVKYQNNSVIAVARMDDIRAFQNGEIERGKIQFVCFAPAVWFDGKYSVREAGISGSYDDLAALESAIGVIDERNIYVPFSNAGWDGSGWQSDINEFGGAHVSTFLAVFGESLGETGARAAYALMKGV